MTMERRLSRVASVAAGIAVGIGAGAALRAGSAAILRALDAFGGFFDRLFSQFSNRDYATLMGGTEPGIRIKDA